MKYLLPLIALSLVVACGDDSTAADAGPSPDAAANDVGPDTDAGPGTDVGPGTDAGDDAGAIPDGGTTPGPWAWCPTSADYVGDSAWTDRLTVPEIVWCVMGNENRTLQEDMDNKAQLWVAPGEYPYPPRVAGTGSMTLPFCINTAAGEGPSATGDGMFEVMVGDAVSEFSLTNTLDNGWEFAIGTWIESDGVTPLPWPGYELDETLTGGFGVPGQANGALTMNGGLGPCDADESWLELGASAEFPAGTIQISYRGIPGSVTTGPSGGFRVQGTLDGTDFDVTDYFRILYAAEHHHAGGQYVVFFDAPIRGACGLQLNAGSGERSATLVDCDLSPREDLGATMVRGPFE